MSNKRKVGSDLRGVTQLITEATVGVTDLVEAMHKRVVHPPFTPSTPIQNLITQIASIVFKNIKWSTKFIGNNLDKALEKLTSVLGEIKVSEEQEAIRSVLNGVIGDYLEKNKNPLKIEMQFRHQGIAIYLDEKNLKETYPKINGKILLMVHGSCMNDSQWMQNEHNHGEILAKELGKTPIYLNYNSGLHVSTNGRKLSDLLENLVLNWPVAIEEISILAHSMGGLVTRSAFYYGEENQKNWTKNLKKIIFLGTPHHGAPLEKAGNILDVILETIPYSKPFARLGKIRSAGVTDLRYGNLIDEDWQNVDRFKMQGDKRQHVQLPENVDCYSIAGVVGKKSISISSKLVGDKMVNVKSALGKHKKTSKNLQFLKENTYISYETSHVELLSNPKIYAKIKSWMSL